MNEYCKNCKSKEVCKIYDFLSINSNVVDLSINECQIFEDKNSNAPIVETTTQYTEPPKMTFRDYKNFNTIKKENNTISFPSVEEIFCKECNCKIDTLQNLAKCSICGGITCSECSYIEPDEKGNTVFICNTCWEEK